MIKITNSKIINTYCFNCPNVIKGKPLDDDFPIYEYECKLQNKKLEHTMIIPHWCTLEDYKKEYDI